MNEFDSIDIKVSGYHPLSAEEARQLYARYVQRGLAVQAMREELEALRKENDGLRLLFRTVKSDYWFMINLIENYSSNKEQTLSDVLYRMKFRKPLFDVLEEKK